MITTFHAYLHLWLWQPASEPTNDKDRLAVAIIQNDTVVGHMPYTLPPLLSDEGSEQRGCRNYRRESSTVVLIWDWKFPASTDYR